MNDCITYLRSLYAAHYLHILPVYSGGPRMVDKQLSLREAIASYVHDGMSVAIEGFTAFICFAAGHEIIRQKMRDLTLIRMTPDLIYDQMVAAGTASALVFSYLGNPGVGSLHCLRRAIENGIPNPLAIEEYSHYGMVARYTAGATHLPFFPLRSYLGSDMPEVNPRIQFVDSPYGDGKVAVVPPLNPDLAIIHAQRADKQGNTQLWGVLGVQKEAAFAAKKVIVVVEDLVDEAVIRSDPNRTLIPGLIVDAVVHMPYGAHPSYVQGYYDRDNEFYLAWDRLSRDQKRTEAWLDEWVHGVADHAEYLQKLGTQTLERIQPGSAPASPVNYGAYV
jgi:glutaconate CoA-transferase, subunit A